MFVNWSLAKAFHMLYVVMYVISLPTNFHLHICNGSSGIAMKPKASGNVRKAFIFLLYIDFVTSMVLLLSVGN
jgi:hypothetical protein